MPPMCGFEAPLMWPLDEEGPRAKLTANILDMDSYSSSSMTSNSSSSPSDIVFIELGLSYLLFAIFLFWT
jgi:hypothetical protein